MARKIRIWETDPASAPKPRPQRFANDLVGRFRSGYQLRNRPVALTEWRVTTGDPDVAKAIQDLLGGDEPQQWETSGEDNLEVYTERKQVKVILDGPDALRQEMVLWGRAGAIRRCDGVEQHGEDAKGKPCECPASYADRKDAAKKGTGCQPSITLYFKLADAPDLGRFKFVTGSWSLLRELGDVTDTLTDIEGPTLAWLGLEEIEYEAKDTGQRRKFTKPVIEIVGPAPAEERYEEEQPPF